MMNIKHASVLLLSLLLALSCSSGNKIQKHRYTCSKKVSEAIEKFNTRKYGAVKFLLEDVKIQCQGNESMDTVLYYLAGSLMHMRMYAEAKLEYQRLSQDFPSSPFYQEAVFRIGYCVLRGSRSADRDQTETHDAVKLLRDFLDTYTDSPFADSAKFYMKQGVDKLAEKEFRVANFYQKIKEYEASVVYYKAFITDFPASDYIAQAKYSMGEALLNLNRKDEAREVLNGLIAEANSGEWTKKARDLLSKVRN